MADSLYFSTTATLSEGSSYYLDLITMTNKQKIKKFSQFNKNWDGYNAQIISENVIRKSLKLLTMITFQPQVYPTPRGSIQFEYYNEDDYLEIEITTDNYILTKITKTQDIETSETNELKIVKEVQDFYAK